MLNGAALDGSAREMNTLTNIDCTCYRLCCLLVVAESQRSGIYTLPCIAPGAKDIAPWPCPPAPCISSSPTAAIVVA